MRRTAEPAAQVSPVLAWATLAWLAFALLYPSVAYPSQGLLGAVALIALAAIGGLALPQLPRPIIATLLVAAAWAFWRVARSPFAGAPLAFAGRGDVVTAGLTLAALLVGIAAARAHARPFLIGILALLAFEAAHGIYQVHGPAGWPQTFKTMERQVALEYSPTDPMGQGLLAALREGRASGTIGAPNLFGTLCAAGIVLALGLAITQWGIGLGWAALALVPLMGAALVLSGSRGGILAALAGGSILIATLAIARFSPVWRRRALVGAAAMAVLAVLAIALLAILPSQGRSRWLGATGMTQRFAYWQAAAAMTAERPLLGNGPGAFELHYARLRLPGSNETQHAHNFLLEETAAFGALGLLLLLGILGSAAFALARSLPAAEPAPRDTALLFAMIAATVFLHALIEYSLSFREIALLAFLSIGAGIGSTLQTTTPAPRNWRPILLIASLFLILLILRKEIPPMRAGALMEEAQYLTETRAPYPEIIAVWDAAIAADPSDPRLYEARAYTRRGSDPAGALMDLEAAVRLHPSSARLQAALATYWLERNDLAKALTYQREAVRLHPLEVVHAVRLAELQFLSGDREGALATFARAKSLLVLTASDGREVDRVAAVLGIAPPN